MQKVSRSVVVTPRSPQKNGRPVAQASQAPRLSLPTRPTEVIHDINEYSFLIHGKRKIGKTSMSVAEDKVFLLTFDPLQISRPILQRHVTSWQQCEDYVGMLEDALRKGAYPYSRVVIDGSGMWARHCQTWIAKTKYGLTDWADIDDHGNQWDRLTATLELMTNRLLALPGRCWFIAHSEWKDVKTRRGEKIDALAPAFSKRADTVLVGMTDVQGAYDYDGNERVLIIEGNESVTAGHRIEGHFKTPDGRNVQEIPMGNDEFEAWDNIKNAFANRQQFINLVERDQQAARRRKTTTSTTLPSVKK